MHDSIREKSGYYIYITVDTDNTLNVDGSTTSCAELLKCERSVFKITDSLEVQTQLHMFIYRY